MKAQKTFIIRHKETKKVWMASSCKTSWKQTNHAKNAWVHSFRSNGKFDDQDEYEIVELKHQDTEILDEVEKELSSILFGGCENGEEMYNRLHNLYKKIGQR